MKTPKQIDLILKSMTAKDLILLMVDSLQNPITDKVNMETYGTLQDGICFGCAATNTLYNICDITNEYVINNSYHQKLSLIYNNNKIILKLEFAINALRLGNILLYNNAIGKKYPNLIIKKNRVLPILETYNYLDNLQHYINFANAL